ncbi:MAG: metal-dependent transcriptional regulator [Promethearchaeota archaeon]
MRFSKSEIEIIQFLYEWVRPIRIGDLKNYLNKPHSSLNSIIRRLERNKIVTWKKYGPVELTNKGKEKGAHFSRHHALMEILLVEGLQMNAKDAHEESLEHASFLSCRVIDLIAQQYEFVKAACGMEIPQSEGYCPKETK